jgi:hypothetical protein
MRTSKTAALAAALLVFVASTATAAGTYSDLRRSEPAVDLMVAAAPSSALHGRLNRIAALLQPPRVRDLPAGSWEALPEGFERDMVRALDALGEEAADALATLDGGGALTLLFAVDRVAFRRNVELHAGAPWEYCGPGVVDCTSPPVLAALDRLGHVLADAFYLLADHYAAMVAEDPLLPAFEVLAPEGYNSQSFTGEVDDAIATTARALGVPSIDD